MSQCHHLGSTLHLQGWIKTPPIAKGGNPQQSSQTNYLHSSTVDTFVLLIYYFPFRIFRTLLGYLFELFFRYFGYKDTINFRYWVKIGRSRNLQGFIVPVILPVPCVIRHNRHTAAIRIVIHETRLWIEIDNAQYLVSYYVPIMLLFNTMLETKRSNKRYYNYY